jgi:hypothetical protein
MTKGEISLIDVMCSPVPLVDTPLNIKGWHNAPRILASDSGEWQKTHTLKAYGRPIGSGTYSLKYKPVYRFIRQDAPNHMRYWRA